MKKAPFDFLFWLVMASLIFIGIPLSLIFTAREKEHELQRLVLTGSLLDGTLKSADSVSPDGKGPWKILVTFTTPDGKHIDIRETWQGDIPKETLKEGAPALVYYAPANRKFRAATRNHPDVKAFKAKMEQLSPPPGRPPIL